MRRTQPRVRLASFEPTPKESIRPPLTASAAHSGIQIVILDEVSGPDTKSTGDLSGNRETDP